MHKIGNQLFYCLPVRLLFSAGTQLKEVKRFESVVEIQPDDSAQNKSQELIQTYVQSKFPKIWMDYFMRNKK